MRDNGAKSGEHLISMMPVEEYRPNRGINSGRNLEDEAEQEIERSADESCPGDRENPGPDDIEGHSPADGRQALGRPDPRDGPGYDMRSADRDAHVCGQEDAHGAGRLSAEPVDRAELRDLLPDSPATVHATS